MGAATAEIGVVHHRPLSVPRTTAGFLLAVLLPPALTALLYGQRPGLSLGLVEPLYILAAVVVALVGGLIPAIAAAVWASLLANWFFVPPYGTLLIADPGHAAELIVAVGVASVVAVLVDSNGRRTSAAVRAQAEATALAELSGMLLGAPDQLGTLLTHAVSTLEVDSAGVLRRTDGAVVSATPGFAVSQPGAGVRTAAGPGHELVLSAVELDDSRGRLLRAYGVHAGAILHRRELEASARTAAELARDNRARRALLSAVSHDLRTPLAGIKAAIGSLRSTDVDWSESDAEELKEAIEESADRLGALVDNLLDLSRLQTGALVAQPREIDLGEVVPATVAGLSEPSRAAWSIAPDARYAVADPGLLERVLGNVLENALRYQPASAGPVRVSVERSGPRVAVRVIDDGVGVPADARERIFQPFQRMADGHTEGTGLGLAVARGLAEAMDGTVSAEAAPGGGLCVVATLPAVATRGAS